MGDVQRKRPRWCGAFFSLRIPLAEFGGARDPLGFARGRLFDFVAAPLSRSGHAQDDKSGGSIFPLRP